MVFGRITLIGNRESVLTSEMAARSIVRSAGHNSWNKSTNFVSTKKLFFNPGRVLRLPAFAASFLRRNRKRVNVRKRKSQEPCSNLMVLKLKASWFYGLFRKLSFYKNIFFNVQISGTYPNDVGQFQPRFWTVPLNYLKWRYRLKCRNQHKKDGKTYLALSFCVRHYRHKRWR